MDVFGVLRQTKRKLLCDPRPKLGRCLFGKGNDQKIIDIAFFRRAEHAAHQPLHQHLRLAGAGCRRDQDRSAAPLHGKRLRLR